MVHNIVKFYNLVLKKQFVLNVLVKHYYNSQLTNFLGNQCFYFLMCFVVIYIKRYLNNRIDGFVMDFCYILQIKYSKTIQKN